MTHDDRKPDLNEAIAAVRADAPGEKDVQDAGSRIWARMQASEAEAISAPAPIRGCEDVRTLLPAYVLGKLPAARALLVRDHLHECVDCRRLAQSGTEETLSWAAPIAAARIGWSWRQYAAAAAVLALVAASVLIIRKEFSAPAGMRAKVQSVQGTLYRVSPGSEVALKTGDELAEGEALRTGNGSHAFVQLRDGSLVEVNQRAEFSVALGWRNTAINLDHGDIIVQAAKRNRGHLYVVTPDCRVAVTGTVFAVNSALKGSRVSVIEGEVHVGYGGADHVLHAGDQVATSSSMSPVPVRQEIAWSQDLDKHLALLAQFAALQKKFEQIPMPGLRYTSDILGRLPANTVVYGSMPNVGEALNEANRIFQDQLQQSAVLREWWQKGHHQGDGMTFDQIVDKVHALSQYLGEEVVLVGTSGPHEGGPPNVAFVAPVRDANGLRTFLQTEFSSLGRNNQGEAGFQVLDEKQLRSAPTAQREHLLAVVRPDFVLFSPSVRTLQLLDAQLNAGQGTFSTTAFGQRVAQLYTNGAGFLLAVDLERITAEEKATAAKQAVDHSGFGELKYLIVAHRDLSGVPDNRAVLEFAGQRQGVASWLAAPAAMGSLEFVSPNAGAAFSILAKSPALAFDDILRMSGRDPAKTQQEMAEAEAKLNVNLREEVMARFDGEITVALDGPVLPKPSWKLIAEVNDSDRLQAAIERLIEAVNQEAARHAKPGVQLQKEESGQQVFYHVRSLEQKLTAPEIYYAFADGYLIAAPSRALVANALETHTGGNSLARSADFRSLLPRDEHGNFSGLFYQNLSPLLSPLASQLPPQQLQSLKQLVADSKPTVICAYGAETRIEVVSSSQLPFNLNSAAFATLLGAGKAGTSHPRSPY